MAGGAANRRDGPPAARLAPFPAIFPAPQRMIVAGTGRAWSTPTA